MSAGLWCDGSTNAFSYYIRVLQLEIQQGRCKNGFCLPHALIVTVVVAEVTLTAVQLINLRQQVQTLQNVAPPPSPGALTHYKLSRTIAIIAQILLSVVSEDHK